MFQTIALLLFMLVIILIAAEIFTNALEHLGQKLAISEGVTGSIFAAVATAMPETMVPLLAILGGSGQSEVNQEIGVGAILGAPLMLGTLSTCLMGMSVWRQRGPGGRIVPEMSGFLRDLNFFLGAYALAALAMFMPQHGAGAMLRAALCLALVLAYLIYALLTLRASSELVDQGHGTEAHGVLFLARLGLPPGWTGILLQLLAGMGLLIGGAEGFISGVKDASGMLGISPLLLSLMVIPIATELPEKINSILWIRKGRDTLSFGNITGAMVFQGTLLPAIGIALTPWTPRHEVFISLTVTLAAALWLRCIARRGIRVWHLSISGALYVLYLALTLHR
jgi:cation:H+ antiporter